MPAFTTRQERAQKFEEKKNCCYDRVLDGQPALNKLSTFTNYLEHSNVKQK